MNVTVPVGTAAPGASTSTVAVKVNGRPIGAVATGASSVVFDDAVLTVCGNGGETLGATIALPA